MEDDIQINAKSFFNKGLKKHQSIQNYSNNLFTNDLLYLMVSNSRAQSSTHNFEKIKLLCEIV